MTKNIISECIRIAKYKIKNHPLKEKKHFCFVVQGNKIISIGMNRNESARTEMGYPPYSKRHAELDAWMSARKIYDKFKKFEIFNIRMNNSGDLRMSKPCQCCHTIMAEYGCSKAYFTTKFGIAKIIL